MQRVKGGMRGVRLGVIHRVSPGLGRLKSRAGCGQCGMPAGVRLVELRMEGRVQGSRINAGGAAAAVELGVQRGGGGLGRLLIASRRFIVAGILRRRPSVLWVGCLPAGGRQEVQPAVGEKRPVYQEVAGQTRSGLSGGRSAQPHQHRGKQNPTGDSMKWKPTGSLHGHLLWSLTPR